MEEGLLAVHDLLNTREIIANPDELYDTLGRLQNSLNKEQQFVAEISHELRTFIAVILSQCEYASGGSKEEMENALRIIYNRSQGMMKMVSSLSGMSGKANDKQSFIRERVNLSELLYFVTEEMEILAKKMEIFVYADIQEDIFIDGDETRLLRIFLNLISNAIRYGRKDGYVFVKLWQNGKFIYGSIEDDGIGMAEEDLPKIWNRFYQVDSYSRKDGSMGLGLAMVKEDIKAHKGIISVESELGVGTCFKIKLPVSG